MMHALIAGGIGMTLAVIGAIFAWDKGLSSGLTGLRSPS